MINLNRTRLLNWEVRPYSQSGSYRGFLWVLIETEHHPEYRGRDYEYAHTIQMWNGNRPLKRTLFFTNIANPQKVAERKINSYLDKTVPIHYDH